MSLIVYLPKMDEAGKRLQCLVGELISQDSIELFYTFHGLDVKLKNFSGNRDIALLLASTRQELDELLARRVLLSSLRVVLIIPDREKETISKGHLLRPRYLSFRDGDFSDVAQVLQKLLNTASSNPHLTQQGEGLPQRGGGC